MDILQAFCRFIDYQAYLTKIWFNECEREGYKCSNTQKIYQHHYNMLVAMRARVTEEYLAQFLDETRFDMPEATKELFLASGWVSNDDGISAQLDKEARAFLNDLDESKKHCEKAPVGWQCSRNFGHPGPCAAYPI